MVPVFVRAIRNGLTHPFCNYAYGPPGGLSSCEANAGECVIYIYRLYIH